MLRIVCHCTSLPSTWPKVYSKISLHKVTMLMFSHELIWRGEICYTNIVVSGLILKMRSEDALLEKWCNSLPFTIRSVTLAIKADHEAAEHFACHRGPTTKDSENWLSLHADWPRSILYCYLVLTFGKLSMLICSEVYSIGSYLPTFGKLTRWQLSDNLCMRSSLQKRLRKRLVWTRQKRKTIDARKFSSL